MKKIGVFLNCGPEAGGQFQYNLSLLSGLDGFDRSIYEIIGIYENRVWEKYLNEYSFKPFFVTFNSYSMSKKIEKLKCNIIIWPSEGMVLPEIACIPVVVMLHDMNYYYEKRFPEFNVNFGYEFRHKLYNRLCDKAVGIFVDSALGKKQIIELYGKCCEEKIYVLPFCPPRYLYDYQSGKLKMEEINLNLPEKYIYYPAQFYLHKNHKNLILALAQLINKNHKIHLVFSGAIQRNGYDEIVDLIRKLNLTKYIHIIGYVSQAEIYYLYKNARAMIMPTFAGPTNIPPLEGLLLGCPVAVSNIHAMPAQIDGAGLTFNPESVDEIAATMEKLWFDDTLCMNLKEKGFSRIEEFSAGKFSERLQHSLIHIMRQLENRNRYIENLQQFACQYKYVFCYGAGEYGYWIERFLASRDIKIVAFIETDKKTENIRGIPVWTIEEIPFLRNECGIILSLSEEYHMAIKNRLKKKDFCNSYGIDKNHLWEIYSFFNIFPEFL